MAPAFVTSTTLSSGLLHNSSNRLTSNPLPPSRHVQSPPRFSMSARKFFVGGNWKCNLSKAEISSLVASFNAGPPLDSNAVEVVVSPPALYLDSTRSQLRPDFATASQNTWISAGGAFTGELDAAMVKDVGGEWAILGHSERRHLPEIDETDDVIAQKAAYALKEVGLGVIYCIGELLEEREAGYTVAVCERQLKALAEAVTDWENIVLAYEPVWAIGTGKVATPEQAEEVHVAVREWLRKNVGEAVAEGTRILYGGSVNPGNCEELAKQKNIDGFLVGGASLKPGFLQIVDSYKAALAAV